MYFELSSQKASVSLNSRYLYSLSFSLSLSIYIYSYYAPNKRSDSLSILKNSKKNTKNIKFDLPLDIHMKIISYGWIGHLHFDNDPDFLLNF
jgi:hypothetical protein